ncbi:MAG: substrate-binding domain-containing protein [Burkholderiales bacterium]
MYLTIRGVCVIALLFSFGQALAAQIKISGSDTMESLAQNALSQYARGQGKGVVVTTDFRGTSQGFKDLCEGRVAMALASTIIDSETARAARKQVSRMLSCRLHLMPLRSLRIPHECS